MTFWTDNNFEPKQNFKFLVQMSFLDLDIKERRDETIFREARSFYAKKADKPSFQLNTKEFKYLNRTINIPTNTTWNPITITFIDDTSNNILEFFARYFISIKNDFSRNNATGGLSALKKEIASDGSDILADSPSFVSLDTAKKEEILDISIIQINNNGDRIETWNLYKPQIRKFVPSGLDYSSEELSEYSVEIVYDWASLDDNIDTIRRSGPDVRVIPGQASAINEAGRNIE